MSYQPLACAHSLLEVKATVQREGVACPRSHSSSGIPMPKPVCPHLFSVGLHQSGLGDASAEVTAEVRGARIWWPQEKHCLGVWGLSLSLGCAVALVCDPRRVPGLWPSIFTRQFLRHHPVLSRPCCSELLGRTTVSRTARFRWRGTLSPSPTAGHGV